MQWVLVLTLIRIRVLIHVLGAMPCRYGLTPVFASVLKGMIQMSLVIQREHPGFNGDAGDSYWAKFSAWLTRWSELNDEDAQLQLAISFMAPRFP